MLTVVCLASAPAGVASAIGTVAARTRPPRVVLRIPRRPGRRPDPTRGDVPFARDAHRARRWTNVVAITGRAPLLVGRGLRGQVVRWGQGTGTLCRGRADRAWAYGPAHDDEHGDQV